YERIPFLAREIPIRQRDAVSGVSNPVHGAQRRGCEKSLTQMILDYHLLARDSAAFAEQPFGVIGMMEDVHARDDVGGPRRKRKRASVEEVDRNGGRGSPLEDVHAA